MQKAKFLKKTKSSLHTISQTTILARLNQNQQPMISLFTKEDGEGSEAIAKNLLPQFRIIAAFRKQIFIIQHPQLDLIGFVDQHALHERVRYQYYLGCMLHKNVGGFDRDGIQKNGRQGRAVLGNSVHVMQYINRDRENWPSWAGSSIYAFEFKISLTDHGIFLTEYPFIFDKELAIETLIKIAQQILSFACENPSAKAYLPRTLDHIIGQKACKGAIKFGDQVSVKWCQLLLYNAALCDFPWSCVHGRPTVYFKRLNWRKRDCSEQKEYVLL